VILHLPKCWDGKTLRQTQKGEILTGFTVESETFAVGRESGRFRPDGICKRADFFKKSCEIT